MNSAALELSQLRELVKSLQNENEALKQRVKNLENTAKKIRGNAQANIPVEIAGILINDIDEVIEKLRASSNMIELNKK